MSEAMISGLRCSNEGYEFFKKPWNPLLYIGALPLDADTERTLTRNKKDNKAFIIVQLLF